jgi:hypothetical protein
MSITSLAASSPTVTSPAPVYRNNPETSPTLVRPRLDGFNPSYGLGLTVSVVSPDRSVEASINVGMLMDVYL